MALIGAGELGRMRDLYEMGGHKSPGSAKAVFLGDAATYLRRLAPLMAARGLATCEVRTNPGGVAVPGDAYGSYVDLAARRGVYVHIGGPTFAGGGRAAPECFFRSITPNAHHRDDELIHWRSGRNIWAAGEHAHGRGLPCVRGLAEQVDAAIRQPGFWTPF